MPARIDRVAMTAFRGATSGTAIDLDATKPITLIFGENGSGKSTIVDAIDFVLNEEYGSLNERSSTNPKSRYLPSIGSSRSKLEVSVGAGRQTWTGRLSSTGPKTGGPASRPNAAILRRSQLLQFISETPKKRYEALQEFISLPAIEKSETSLRAAHKNASSKYESAVKAKEQASEALSALWNDEGRQGKTAWAWAASQAGQDATDLGNSVATLSSILTDLDAASDIRERMSAAREHHGLHSAALRTCDDELRGAEASAVTGGTSLVSLLEEVKRYFENHQRLEACPVCESPERTAGLHESVSRRLGEMKHLVALKKKAGDAKAAAQKSLAVLAHAEAAFLTAVRRLWLSNGATLAKAIKIDAKAFQLLSGTEPILAGGESMAEAHSLWQAVADVRERITSRRDRDQKTLNQLTAVKNYVSIVEAKTGAASELQAQVKRLNALLAIVETQRKRYIDEVLASVEGFVERMYSRVHPNEGVGSVRLYLKPNVIGSLEFDAKFQTASAAPPQAYYSDSHLDTLGVCIFLALARHFNDEGGVIILDDVLTSADSDHLERLMTMIEEEAERFNQLIVTTHYRPWLERYRRLESESVGLIELAPWSMERGIRSVDA